jgi:hypothetical protein
VLEEKSFMTKYLSKKKKRLSAKKVLKEKFEETAKSMPFNYPLSTVLGVSVAERS